MKPLYIFDLDGTLADCAHRRHLVEGENPDWDAFYDACDLDTPIKPTIKVMHTLQSAGAEIWIVSGRSDRVLEKTVHWLGKHTYFFVRHLIDNLIMRPVDDHSSDVELKQRVLDNMLTDDRERLVAVFDDRTRVVQMWRKNGIQCYQVAPGDF